MNKPSFNFIASALVVLMSSLIARADYSNAVITLNPAAYWPLQEINASVVHLATNSGTLGAQADAHYDNAFYILDTTNFYVESLFPGPTAGVTSDGDAGQLFNGGTNNDDNSQFLMIPDVNHDLDQGGPAFTAEAWVKPEGGDPNDPTGTSFASTEWTSIIEKGGGGLGYNLAGDTASTANTYGWSMELAGKWSLGYPVGWYTPGSNQAGLYMLQTNACWVVDMYGGNNGSSPSMEFMVPFQEPTPQWFHLVLTYDGTNANFYTNGVLAATTVLGTPASTNEVFSPNQSPETSPTGAYQFANGYAADTNEPMVIGNINPQSSLSGYGYPDAPIGTVGFNCQNFNGVMDEVAFYTNAFSAATVLKHYQDATSPNTTLYTNDVLSAYPPVYLRLDEPKFTADPATGFSTFPTVANLGSMSSATGYQVNVLTDVPGPQGPGLNSDTNAIFCDGLDAAVDVGNGGLLYKTELDPTNFQPFSVAFWFRGNPADIRFQTILGRGNSGWRFDMDPSGDIHWNPGNNPEVVTPVSYDDGLWHQAIGVSDGTNAYLYIDGQLSVSGAGVGSLSGTPLDLLIGGAPDYSGGSGNRFFSGQISQVAFFTTALSAAQAAALYDDAASLAPEITGNPQPLAVNLGGSGSFNVVASGQPVTYQWYQASTELSDVPGNISGSATDTLTITNATGANAGNYTVVVANNYGSVTSVVATLTVYSNVVITSDITPVNVTLFAGGHATFSIVAAGASPISYQWYTNGVAAGGATSSSYTFPNAQANSTVYCVASNSYGPVPSSTANVTVIADPTASYPLTILAANPVGFWRLNETGPDGTSGPNNGTVANDYWGGDDGIYTNTSLGNPGYNPTGEPSETSAGFLVFSNAMAYNIPNIDFSAPSNSSPSFSVECWANGYAQTSDAGIVSKGVSGGEQFDLDTGANDPAHDYRFLVRDASGATHNVNSTNAPDGSWHHLVGVCDEADGYVALYVDGQLVGTNTITPGSGILATSQDMKIGSRPGSADPNANSDQFDGYMDDVAVYNYALTAAQVLGHFDAADIPARIAVQPPATVVADLNGSATITAVVEGTPPLTNQWWNLSTGQPVAGATNTTLVLNNIQSSATYYLTAANAFGSAQSQNASLQVVSGAPQIQPYGQDVQSPFFALQGGTGSDAFIVYGTAPISYQWQFFSGGVWGNLTDGNGVSGSQSNVLTIANAQPSEGGNYRVIAQNTSGSITSSVALFIVGNPIQFYGPADWQANGNAIFGTNQLTLTEGGTGETSSYFFNTPQYIGAFDASFTYTDVNGNNTVNGTADGFTFIVQNSPAGVNALAGGGSALGYANPAITPSAELCFELYNNGDNAPGMAWATDGAPSAGVVAGGFKYNGTGPVSIISGDPIDVSLYYDGAVLAVNLSDETTKAAFSTNIVVGSLPQIVNGDTAYVGFTGATGGIASTQTITNFSFVSIPVEAISATRTNAVISWSAAVGGYLLQENSNLATTNWVNVTNSINVVNGLNQVTVPLGASNQFFRLHLP